MQVKTERISLETIPRTASFVRFHPSPPGALGRNMEVWAPDITGDWTIDCSRGRAYAEEALDFMRATDNPSCLGHIVKGMIGAGRYTGVEVGFLQRIAEEALTA